MRYDLRGALLPFRIPLLHPLCHFSARVLVPHIHCRNDPAPVNREREASELEERAVLAVRHAIKLQRCRRVAHWAKVRVREHALLRAGDD